MKIDDNNYKLEYSPKEIGLHKIEIFDHEKAIWDKPTLIEVCDPSRVVVSSPNNCLQGKECCVTG